MASSGPKPTGNRRYPQGSNGSSGRSRARDLQEFCGISELRNRVPENRGVAGSIPALAIL
jgi:hypothetical protein